MAFVRAFVGSTLQDAAHGALAEAQRAARPFDLVLLEGDFSGCGLVPPAFTFAEGGVFGDEGNWARLGLVRPGLSVLVITTASADAVEARRVLHAGNVHIWRLVRDREDMRGVDRFVNPAPFPKLSRQAWTWATAHCVDPDTQNKLANASAAM